MNRSQFIDLVSPFSMTSIERITALYESLEHIRLNNTPGDLVECGVWRGGNILGMMAYCIHYNLDKKIWLYDTFEGMTAPDAVDTDLHNNPAELIFERVRCYCPLAEVKQNLSAVNFPEERVTFVVGDVNKTLRLQQNIPATIAILRLDTDWYESTFTELTALYPRLANNGILIIDDYGHWRGCKKATDDYFSGRNAQFKQIDYTGVLHVKDTGALNTDVPTQTHP
jgi:hypothetical protein